MIPELIKLYRECEEETKEKRLIHQFDVDLDFYRRNNFSPIPQYREVRFYDFISWLEQKHEKEKGGGNGSCSGHK